MSEIAGRDRISLRLDALAIPFKVLRLWSVSGPPAGASTMESERAADAAVGIAPGEQGVDLRRRRMCRPEPELHDAANNRIEFLAPQGMPQRRLAQILNFATVFAQPSQ